MLINLYVKQHNVTGLKYFGATIRDPYAYQGSGIQWIKHCRKHGFDISTIEVFVFEVQAEAERFAIQFSRDNNIVRSNQWANLIIEDALVRRETYHRSDSTRKKLSEIAKQRVGELNPFYGKQHSLHTKQQISAKNQGRSAGSKNPFFGKKHTEDVKAKIADVSRGRIKTKEERLKLSSALLGLKKAKVHKDAISSYAKKRIWIVNQDGKLSHAVDIHDPRITSGLWQIGRKWRFEIKI